MFLYILLGICALAFAGVFFGATMLLGGGKDEVEERLTVLTKNRGRGVVGQGDALPASVLTSPLEDQPTALEQFLGRLSITRFIDQSGLKISAIQFTMMTLGLGFGASVIYMVSAPWRSLIPVVFLTGASLPVLYIWWVRRSRLKRFAAQLPEALDLMGQALRAGQSLPAGIQLVASQMEEPIGPEFARAYEQQNLGVAMEDALRGMSDRIPNLDLKFFVTSVVLQRQTGGDLAEILDKIATLIRQRFQIWGQIQALTGEGRLSGIVLLALPPALFLAMLKLNYDYVMMLFEDPLGQKMLIFGIIMQIFGAAAIKKIITIKV